MKPIQGGHIPGGASSAILFVAVAALCVWIQTPVGPYSFSPEHWDLFIRAAKAADPSRFVEDLTLSSRSLNQLYPQVIIRLINVSERITGDYENGILLLQFILLGIGMFAFQRIFLLLTDDLLVSSAASLIVALSFNFTSAGDVWGFFPIDSVLARNVFLLLYLFVLYLAIRLPAKGGNLVLVTAALAALFYVHPLYAPAIGVGTWVFLLVKYRRHDPETSLWRFVALTAVAPLLIISPYVLDMLRGDAFLVAGSGLPQAQVDQLVRAQRSERYFSVWGAMQMVATDMVERNPGLLVLAFMTAVGMGSISMKGKTYGAPDGEHIRRSPAAILMSLAVLVLPAAVFLLSRDSYDVPSPPLLLWYQYVGDSYIYSGPLALSLMLAAGLFVLAFPRIPCRRLRNGLLAGAMLLVGIGLYAVITRNIPYAHSFFFYAQAVTRFVSENAPGVALTGIGILAMGKQIRELTLALVLCAATIFAFNLVVIFVNLNWLNIPTLHSQVRVFIYVYIFLPLIFASLLPAFMAIYARGHERMKNLFRFAWIGVLGLSFVFPLWGSIARSGIYDVPPEKGREHREISRRDLNVDAEQLARYLRAETDPSAILFGPSWLEYKTLRTLRYDPARIQAHILQRTKSVAALLELDKLRPRLEHGCEILKEDAEKLKVSHVVYTLFDQKGLNYYLKRNMPPILSECTVFRNRSFIVYKLREK